MGRALALLSLSFAICAGAESAPDFDALDAQIDSALAAVGRGGQAGERVELDRIDPSGWEILISAAWDGESWRLLALRLLHPERALTPDHSWLDRYQTLMAGLEADMLNLLERPQLFEVPPPAFLPVLPEELRTRQFEFEGFWYRASWLNGGGPDEFASWALRSFELVADPRTLQPD